MFYAMFCLRVLVMNLFGEVLLIIQLLKACYS